MKICLSICLCLLFVAGCASHSKPGSQSSGKSKYIQEYEDLNGLYQQLLSFRDDPEFLKDGFATNSTHAEWLHDVQGLQKKPGYSPDGPRLLAMLAMASRQKGKDNDITKQLTTKLEELLSRARIERDAALTFLYTGDTQGVLNTLPSKPKPMGGLARRPPLLTALRGTESNVLLLDTGDAFASGAQNAATINTVLVDAMNTMHYDALGLGPKDLAVGEEELRKLAATAKFPFICSNIVNENKEVDWIKPYALVKRANIDVAIMSIMPPLKDTLIPGMNFISAQQALRKYLPELKSKAKAIVLLTQHEGFEIAALLDKTDPIDVVFCDAKGKFLDEPKYIFPAISKGMGLGMFRMEMTDAGTMRAASQSVIPLLDDAVDAEIQQAVAAIK